MKKTTEVKLSSGRKVTINNDIPLDICDNCGDLNRLSQEVDGNFSIYGYHKAETAWIRAGLLDGDFKYGPLDENKKVIDRAIKELKPAEKTELAKEIQAAQYLGEG